MNRNFRLALAAGALIVAACGDDGGTSDGDDGETRSDASSATRSDASTGGGQGDAGTTAEQTPSSGKCDKGEYKSDESELSFCGTTELEEGCPDIAELSGYTKVNGDLNLFPADNDDLAGASCLESVGSLVISLSEEVTSLKSLSKVKSALSIEVLDNDKLTTLAGFDGLTTISSLTINGNDGLTDLTGLPKGLKIGSLYVASNFELSSLDGLVASEVEISDTLAFENNPKLSSCAAAEFAKKFPDAELSNFGNKVEQCK
jgi:hypothetical protein